MSCILRVDGATLDVDSLRSHVALEWTCSWRRGERPDADTGTIHPDSGALVVVSAADFTRFADQVGDASAFLEERRGVIGELTAFRGVDHVTLDFGLGVDAASTALFSYLPPRLLRLVAEAGIGIEMSVYVQRLALAVPSRGASASNQLASGLPH